MLSDITTKATAVATLVKSEGPVYFDTDSPTGTRLYRVRETWTARPSGEKGLHAYRWAGKWISAWLQTEAGEPRYWLDREWF